MKRYTIVWRIEVFAANTEDFEAFLYDLTEHAIDYSDSTDRVRSIMIGEEEMQESDLSEEDKAWLNHDGIQEKKENV
jgi:hypothetical protein